MSVLFGVAALGAGIKFIEWRSARSLIEASSATSETDSQAVNSTVDGTIAHVYVKPGQVVKTGQLLALISNPDLVKSYQKAQADLQAAEKQDKATQAAILPPPITGGFGPFTMAPPPDLNQLKPLPSVTGASAAPPSSPSPWSHAAPSKPAPDPKRLALDGALVRARKELDRANDQQRIAQSELEAAQSSLQTAKLPLEPLQSALELAKSKRDKFQGLYNDGIISRAEFQLKQSDLDTAQTNLDQAKQNVASADDNVKSKQTDLEKADKNVSSATALFSKAETEVSKSPKPKEAVADKPKPATTVIEVQNPVRHTLPPVRAPSIFAHHKSHVPIPHTGLGAVGLAPVGVAFSAQQHGAAQSKLEWIRNHVKQLEVLVRACKIFATSDGAVTQINFHEGQKVLRKEELFQIMRPSSQRVVATFSHEAALRIHLGERCEVSFAMYPNRTFRGEIARFLESGDKQVPAKVEILVPDKAVDLALLPPGMATQVRVHSG